MPKDKNFAIKDDVRSLVRRFSKFLSLPEECEKGTEILPPAGTDEVVKCNREASVSSGEFLRASSLPSPVTYAEQSLWEDTTAHKANCSQSRFTLSFKSILGKKNSLPSDKSQNIRPHYRVRNILKKIHDKRPIERLSKFLNLPDEYEKGKSEESYREDQNACHLNNDADNRTTVDFAKKNRQYIPGTDDALSASQSWGGHFATSAPSSYEASPCPPVTGVTETVGSISPKVEEVTWNIDDVFTVASKPYFRNTSPTFTFEGYEWRLAMWTDGESRNPGSMNLCLMRKQSCTSNLQTFNWTLGLKRGDGSVNCSVSGVTNTGVVQRRWQSLCKAAFVSQTELVKREDMEASDNCLTIFCRLSLGTETNVPEQKEVPGTVATLCNDLKDLFLSGEDCDVTVEVQGKKYGAHRAILRARTPVLHAMLSHDMSERNSGVISVVDCDPSAFREFLLFVYSGKVGDLSGRNVMNVYYIADKYDLPELKKECSSYIKTCLTSESICDVIRLATRHGDQQLLEEAMLFFVKNVEEILQTVKWQRFLQENSVQANELLIKSFKAACVRAGSVISCVRIAMVDIEKNEYRV